MFKGGVKEDAADVGAGHVVSSRFRTVGLSTMERMVSAVWGMGQRGRGASAEWG